MLSKIKIKDLKCFEEVELSLNNFNLLVGMNSSGKSTVIHALLLAIQNITSPKNPPLNGNLVNLGDFAEARNFLTNAKEISIELSDDSGTVTMKIYEDEDGVKSNIENSGDCSDIIEFLDFTKKHIKYIPSNRIGYMDAYQKNYDDFNEIGILGEYAIDHLNKNKYMQIDLALIKDKNILTLGNNVNFWLNYILNSEVSTEDIHGIDLVKVQYTYDGNRSVRPRNIGTGLSYIISLLIGALSSKKGDLIIVENPEIHLHPRAQSRLTEFLTFVANAGVKFLIETHSDHIFNGLRKSIKKETISSRNASTYFFELEESYLSNAHLIKIDEKGNLLNHHPGLFDQFDDDLDELLGLV